MLAQHNANIDHHAIMESCDDNKDGHVDRVEFLHRMNEAYFFVDNDKDGYLTMDEIHESVEEVDRDGFKSADRDGDEKLSMHEYQQAVQQDFNAIDVNEDGKLSHQEMKTGM